MTLIYILFYLAISLVVGVGSWCTVPTRAPALTPHLICGLFWPLGVVIMASIALGSLVVASCEAVRKWGGK